MASPQLTDGYLKITNDIWDALTKYRVPGEQEQCLKVVIRATYGWNKKEAEISLNDFCERTGINKQNVSRAIKGLIDKNIIFVIKKDNRLNSTYGFNKNYKAWKPLSKKITLSKKIKPFIKKDNPPIKDNTKDITQDHKNEKLQFEKKVTIPSYFHLTDGMIKYADDKKINIDLEEFTENMILACKAKGYKYQDWYATWQNWLRKEWKKQQPIHQPAQRSIEDILK